MSKRIHNLIKIFVFSAACSLIMGSPSQAMPPGQTSEPPSPERSNLQNLNELLNDAFFNSSGDIFHQNSIENQVVEFFGLEFRDLKILDDAQLINYISTEALRQQNDSGPLLRGRELTNPFNTTLMESPCYLRNSAATSCSR